MTLAKNQPRQLFPLLVAIGGVFIAPAFAQAQGACPACPGGTQDVSLMILSNQISSSTAQSLLSAATFRSNRPSGIPNIARTIGNESLRSILTGLAAECKRVKFLQFSSHGDLGFVEMGSDNLTLSNMEAAFGGLDCVMSSNAEIFFDGCNVARGCRGEDFLTGTAAYLLTKGGKVGGFTNYSVGGAISIGFDTQSLTVGSGPTMTPTSWDDPPQTPADCAQRARTTRSEFETVLSRMTTYPACFTTFEKDIASNASSELAAAAVEQDQLGSVRQGFSDAQRQAGRNYFSGFRNYRWMLANLKDRRCTDAVYDETHRPSGAKIGL